MTARSAASRVAGPMAVAVVLGVLAGCGTRPPADTSAAVATLPSAPAVTSDSVVSPAAAVTSDSVVSPAAAVTSDSVVSPAAATSAAAPPAAAPVPASVAPAATLPGGVGTVASTAVRDVGEGVGERCDLDTVAALAARHPDVGQWIVTRTDSFTATAGRLDVAARRRDGTWVCQLGDQGALVGRAGTRPLLDRRSGDGTTPAGVFGLGTTTAWDGQAFQFFGNGPDPGVRGEYRAVQPGDCWGATPGRATYNHLYRSTACSGPDDEYLPSFTGSYVHAAVIGANNEPAVSGDAPGETPYAAAIFLHRHAYDGTRAKPTSGCVSLALEDLVDTLLAIDPALTPAFAIGPTDWLRTTP